MIASKLRRHVALAGVTTPTLKALLWTLRAIDALPEQRAAITHELAVRAWAEAVEERLGDTIGWMRGGKS